MSDFSEHIVLKVVVRTLCPFIFMYGLYIQFHGEFSPGGGFQAGVICAAAFIAYGLVHGLAETMRIMPFGLVKVLSAFGLLLYAFVGVAAMLMGGNFLDYSILASDPVSGQKLGILVIELGVGFTVFSLVMLIFYVFGERL